MDFVNRGPTARAVDLLDPQHGEWILDAGCGTGAALQSVARRARCTLAGIDPSATMISAARNRLGKDTQLACTGLGQSPFSDGTFDAGLALNMLYFVDEQGEMLADFHRVLRPGGRLVAYVTHRETMQHWSFAQTGYHRMYDSPALHDALVKAGFAPDAIMLHDIRVTKSVRGLLAIAMR